MLIRRTCAFCVLILLLAERLAAAFTVFSNPILSAGADPWVVQADGFYYYMQTTGGDLRIRKSTSLINISRVPETIPFTLPPDRKNIWAPELHPINGKWYIYYAADDGNNENHRVYALESRTADPLGPYLDRGQVIRSAPIRWSIDPTVFQQNGQLYLLWSGWEGLTNNPQNLYIAPLATPTTVTAARSLLAQPELPWEGTILEGPEILQHGTNLFLIYSANASWTDDYCLGLLQFTGGALTNRSSWRKLPQPVFSTFSNTFETVYAPGHCSFTLSPDGTEPWIVYHAARQKGSGWDRTIRTQPFSWDTAGLPFFGRPIGVKTPLLVPNGEIPTTRPLPTNGIAALEFWTSNMTNLDSLQHESATRRPDLIRLLTGLEMPADSGDDYGARMLGYVVTQNSAPYVFYLNSSDPAELQLQFGSTNLLHLTSTGGQAQSSPVLLSSNVAYSFQALMAAATGEDFLKITWALQGEPPPDPSAIAINTTNLLFSANLLPPPEPLQIQGQPASMIISPRGGEARLTVQPSGATPYFIQWMANGTDIPCATNSTLLVQTPAAAVGEYVARVRNEYQTIQSEPAKIWTFEITPALELVLSGPAATVQIETSSSLSSLDWKPILTQTVPAGRNILAPLAAQLKTEPQAYYRVAMME